MTKESKPTEEPIIEGVPFEYYHKRHGGGSVFGLVVLFIGILFLLNNLGLVPWNVWDGLWKFWPVVVILIGIKMFVGKNLFSRVLITLLWIFILAGILAYIFYYYGVFKVFGFPSL